jgi:hypothetical protein
VTKIAVRTTMRTILKMRKNKLAARLQWGGPIFPQQA